jgi:Nidogen-like/Thrombospondin type 3 repeat
MLLGLVLGQALRLLFDHDRGQRQKAADRRRRRPPCLILVLGAVLSWVLLGCSLAAAQTSGSASSFCHVTDGQFTVCPDGGREWSDVPVHAFPESQSFLYASQANLDPLKGSPSSPVDTFMLMYDECSRTTPLGPDEYFLVAFKTVGMENGVANLEHYVIHIFSDGTILFIEDGVVQPPGRAPLVDGMRGKAGFGPSPNCPIDHVIAEFQIPLSVTGDSYSPDPLFWSASIPASATPPPPPCKAEQVKVPLLLNILKGVFVDDARVVAIVKEANKLLAPAGVCIEFSPSKIMRNVSDEGNGNSNIDPGENAALYKRCVTELRDPKKGFGRDIGFKVYFTHNILGRTDLGLTPGTTSIPCLFMRVIAGTDQQMGNVLAHEFGHVFGLGSSGHIVDDKGTADPSDDVLADNDAHAPFPNNLMSGDSFGSALTNTQKKTIKEAAKKRGRNSEHGSWTDETGEVSLPHIDLFMGSLFAEDLTGDLEMTINLAGLHPDATDVNSRFEVLFDTDNDSATGVIFGSLPGIDRILEISLTGRFPFTPPAGSMTARLVDVASGASTPLASGSVRRVKEIFDTFDSSVPSSAIDFVDSIEQSLPLSLLELSASEVPTGVRATNLDTGEFDETLFVFTLSLTPGLRAIRPGFDNSTLPGNDDESTGLVPLGFTANFFGTRFSGLFVNNNGNLTFDAPLAEFTPFGLTATNRVIMAPYFADVDTRFGNVVSFGNGLVDGRPAFGVNWPGVGCFDQNASVLNFFQVVLIDRSDVAPGDFDIEFNYDQIQWETGQASGGDVVCQGGTSSRVGFSDGTGAPGTFFELPGSGINGAFLDSNTATGLIHNNLNSDSLGRYVFRVRSGVPVTLDGDGDGVPDDLDNCPRIANADQRDRNFNGIGDACETPDLGHSTAAFMQAGFDGSTTVEPRSVLVANEPSLLEQLIRIVDFRVRSGLTTSAAALAASLVDSQVELGLVPPDQADELINAVLRQTRPPLVGDLDRDGDVDLDDLNILLAERNTPVVDSTCGVSCDLDGDGMITALDARKLVELCTRPRCAMQ